MRTWFLLAGAAAVAACNQPVGGSGFSSVADASASVGDNTTQPTPDATTADTETDATTGSTGDPATSSDPDSSSGGTGTTAGAICGNGMTEDGEQCDDGDDDEFDDCTSQCTVPVCDDGAHNGDETDLDCGGSCQGCELCLQCDGDGDCANDMTCTPGGRCTVHAEISVDWEMNCGGVAQGTIVEDLPAGTYLASAVQSAGTLWEPPHTPPSTGYFYEIQCNAGVDLGNIATPVGVRYATIAEAFANLQSNVQQFDFVGGDLVCYRTDPTCGDNAGMVDFEIDYDCEGL